MDRYGPAKTGSRPEATGPEQLGERWHRDLDALFTDPPVVVDDLVMVKTGSRNGELEILDRESGERRRTATAGVGLNTSPVVMDGRAYVGDEAGKLNVVDTGSSLDSELPFLLDANAEILGAPAAGDGSLYVGDGAGKVYALDASTGDVTWTADTGGVIRTPATVADDTVYVGTDRGAVYALAASDGSEQWRASTDDSVRGSPTVVDGTLYAGSTAGTVYAVDATTGDRQWTATVNDSVDDAVPVSNGTVYASDATGTLTALDAASGARKWETSVDSRAAFAWAPAVTADSIYHHGGGTTLYRLDPASGDELATHDVGEPMEAAPTVGGNAVYVLAGTSVHALGE